MSTESWYLTIAVLTVFLTAVAVLDLRTRRIPNRLTVPAAALAIGINCLGGGLLGALHSVEGLAVGLAAFLPMFLGRGSSGGDVKAMAVVGAFLGPAGAFFAVLWVMVAGLAGGLVVLIGAAGRSGIAELVRRWLFRTYVLCTTGHVAHVPRSGNDAAQLRFPYGLAIASGTMISLVWRAYGG